MAELQGEIGIIGHEIRSRRIVRFGPFEIADLLAHVPALHLGPGVVRRQPQTFGIERGGALEVAAVPGGVCAGEHPLCELEPVGGRTSDGAGDAFAYPHSDPASSHWVVPLLFATPSKAAWRGAVETHQPGAPLTQPMMQNIRIARLEALEPM